MGTSDFILAIIGVVFSGGLLYTIKELKTMKATQKKATAEATTAELDVTLHKCEVEKGVKELKQESDLKCQQHNEQLMNILSDKNKLQVAMSEELQQMRMEQTKNRDKTDGLIAKLNDAQNEIAELRSKIETLQRFVCVKESCRTRMGNYQIIQQ